MVETEYLLIGFILKLSLTYRVKSWFRSSIHFFIRHSLIRLVLIRKLSYRGVLIVRGGSVTNNILLRSWRGPGRTRCSTCFRYFSLKRKQNCRLSGQGRWLSNTWSWKHGQVKSSQYGEGLYCRVASKYFSAPFLGYVRFIQNHHV